MSYVYENIPSTSVLCYRPRVCVYVCVSRGSSLTDACARAKRFFFFFRFWDTQPMKKPGEDSDQPGEIETKTVDEVKAEPYNMPPGFEWCHVDVMDAAEADVGCGSSVFLFCGVI